MNEQLDMMLKGAIASGKDVQAFWSEGRLTRFKYSDPVRGIRTWTVMDVYGGQIRTQSEVDRSDM